MDINVVNLYIKFGRTMLQSSVKSCPEYTKWVPVISFRVLKDFLKLKLQSSNAPQRSHTEVISSSV